MLRPLTRLLLALAAVGLLAGAASAATTLKMATLAPKLSPWGKIFGHAAAEVAELTGGEVTIDIYDSGVQGDEKEAVEKMKTGQLQMAALTTVGLGRIDTTTMIFQLPGLYRNAAQLDKVREAVAPDIERSLADKGFVLLGWGDVGPLHLFSNTPVSSPDDLKKTKFWVWSEDAVGQAVVRAAGATGVPLGVPSVVAALANGKVDAYLTSPLAAASLRWYNRTTHINPVPVAVGIGGVVISKDAFDALSPAHQKVLRDTLDKWSRILTKKVRQDNERTLKLMAGKAYESPQVDKDGVLTVGAAKAGADKPVITAPSAADRARWEAIFTAVQDELAGNLYSKDLLAKVRRLVK